MDFRAALTVVFILCGVLGPKSVALCFAVDQDGDVRAYEISEALKIWEIERALEQYELDQSLPIEESYSMSARDTEVQQALDLLEEAQLDPSDDPSSIEEELPEDVYIKPPVAIRGLLRNEVATRIYDTSHLAKFKNQMSMTVSGEIIPALRYRVSGRTSYDAVYDIQDKYPANVRSGQRIAGELRETYLDYSFHVLDLRVGQQQIVWGEAISVSIADIVNPKDFREFVLPEIDSIRIPEGGVSLEYTHESLNSQFIMLPGIRFNKLGVPGSEFAFPLPVPAGTTEAEFTYVDAKEPKKNFKNSKVGTRVNYLWNSLDMGLFYLHSWTASPVLFRTIDSDVYNFSPEYKRLDSFGATFSTEIKDIIIKGDFVYTKDDFFPVLDPNHVSGIARSGHFDYLLGLDYIFFDHLEINAEFSQKIIEHYHETMFGEDKYNNSISLRIGQRFMNRRLLLELMTIYGMNAPDFLYSPKVQYNLNDSWQMSVGADIFSGNRSGLYGYFRDKSRYFSELTYKF